MEKDIVISCKRVRYYTEIDEDYFFEWIDQISCICKIDGQHDELYLHLKTRQISDEEVKNLVALFKRYKIPAIKQLRIFSNVNKYL